MKQRVLLVADVDGWAFDNIARNIRVNLSEQFEFSTIYMADYTGRPWDFAAAHLIKNPPDIAHFFWRDDLRMVIWPEHIYRTATTLGCSVEAVIWGLCQPVITTSVYDHLHLDPAMMAERAAAFHFAHGYSVSSSKLEALYRAQAIVPPPDLVIADGVRLDFFKPAAAGLRGTSAEGCPLTVGWVGNSRWGDHTHADAKGLQSILKPAIERLRAEGLDVREHFADIQQRKRSRDEMAEYYREIDVLVCASLIEGTPNPILEAMASGVAVVSTDVGVVREALGPRQQDFILTERSIDAMSQALRRLVLDRDLVQRLRVENLRSIREWDWHIRTAGWLHLWQKAKARREEPRLAHYRHQTLQGACQRIVSRRRSSQEEAAIGTWMPSWHGQLRSRLAGVVYRYPRFARTINHLRGRKS